MKNKFKRWAAGTLFCFGGLTSLLNSGCAQQDEVVVRGLPPEHYTQGRQVEICEDNILEPKDIFYFTVDNRIAVDIRDTGDDSTDIASQTDGIKDVAANSARDTSSNGISIDVTLLDGVNGEKAPFDVGYKCDQTEPGLRDCAVYAVDNGIQYEPIDTVVSHWDVNINVNEGRIVDGEKNVIIRHTYSPCLDSLNEEVEELEDRVDVIEEELGIDDGEDDDDNDVEAICYDNADCSHLGGFQGSEACLGNDLVRKFVSYSCENAGMENADCVPSSSEPKVTSPNDPACMTVEPPQPSQLERAVEWGCQFLGRTQDIPSTPENEGHNISLYAVMPESDVNEPINNNSFSYEEIAEMPINSGYHHPLSNSELLQGEYAIVTAGAYNEGTTAEVIRVTQGEVSGMAAFINGENINAYNPPNCRDILVLNPNGGELSEGDLVVYTYANGN